MSGHNFNNTTHQPVVFVSGQVTTTDNTTTTILTIPTTQSSVNFLSVTIVGYQTSGIGLGSVLATEKMASVKNISGTLTLSTVTTVHGTVDDVLMGTSLTTSGENVLIQVTGLLSKNMSWLCEARITTKRV